MSGPAPHKGKYFQFPLCTLDFGRNEQERLEAIIDYGLVEAGKVLWSLSLIHI